MTVFLRRLDVVSQGMEGVLCNGSTVLRTTVLDFILKKQDTND